MHLPFVRNTSAQMRRASQTDLARVLVPAPGCRACNQTTELLMGPVFVACPASAPGMAEPGLSCLQAHHVAPVSWCTFHLVPRWHLSPTYVCRADCPVAHHLDDRRAQTQHVRDRISPNSPSQIFARAKICGVNLNINFINTIFKICPQCSVLTISPADQSPCCLEDCNSLLTSLLVSTLVPPSPS